MAKTEPITTASFGEASHDQHIKTLCKAIWEMCQNAPHDLCGDHRRFYIPRLTDAMTAAARLFPADFARAMYGPAGVPDQPGA
jgi:hypothetical protein